MICPKCGETIPDGSVFCLKCGAELKEPEEDTVEKPVIYPSQNNSDLQSDEKPREKKKSLKRILLPVGAAVIICICVFAFIYIQKAREKAELSKTIQREWSDIDDSITRVMDFSADGEVEYRLETAYSWLDTSVFTCDYRVISGDQIQLDQYGTGNYETYTVTFNDDKTLMIVKPAITSTDSKEFWYDFDD